VVDGPLKLRGQQKDPEELVWVRLLRVKVLGAEIEQLGLEVAQGVPLTSRAVSKIFPDEHKLEPNVILGSRDDVWNGLRGEVAARDDLKEGCFEGILREGPAVLELEVSAGNLRAVRRNKQTGRKEKKKKRKEIKPN